MLLRLSDMGDNMREDAAGSEMDRGIMSDEMLSTESISHQAVRLKTTGELNTGAHDSKLSSFPSIEGSTVRTKKFKSCLLQIREIIDQTYPSDGIKVGNNSQPGVTVDNKSVKKKLNSISSDVPGRPTGSLSSSKSGSLIDCDILIRLTDEMLNQMLLSDEEADDGLFNGCYSELLDRFLQESVTNQLESWSMARVNEGDLESAKRIMRQILCIYDTLLSRSRQRLLARVEFTRALMHHLETCASFVLSSGKDGETEERLVVVLHQVCVGMARHADVIDLLFDLPSNINSEGEEQLVSNSTPSKSVKTKSMQSNMNEDRVADNGVVEGADTTRNIDSVPQGNGGQVIGDSVRTDSSTTTSSTHHQSAPAHSRVDGEGCKGRFEVFSLLIPYIHRSGVLGQQARDALLLIISLSASHDRITKYIIDISNLCPVLATGLSGLYSSLPRTLSYPSDDWHQLTHDDINSRTDLQKFLTSLEFCNAVALVSHPMVRDQLLSFIYNGFLVPVMGPALHQTTTEEVIAATVYLDICMRTITDAALMRVFLRFILQARLEEMCILDVIISRINCASMRLCMVTLTLLRTLVELNCEDVMFQLVFRYLIPCTHVMVSQQRSFKDVDIFCETADKLLSLIPSYCSGLSSSTLVAGNGSDVTAQSSPVAASSSISPVGSTNHRPTNDSSPSPFKRNVTTSVIGRGSTGGSTPTSSSPFERSKSFLSSFRRKSSSVNTANPVGEVSSRYAAKSADSVRRDSVTSETSVTERPSSADSPSQIPPEAGSGAGSASQALTETLYAEYLRHARCRISDCCRACSNWSAAYDGENPSPRLLLERSGSAVQPGRQPVGDGTQSVRSTGAVRPTGVVLRERDVILKGEVGGPAITPTSDGGACVITPTTDSSSSSTLTPTNSTQLIAGAADVSVDSGFSTISSTNRGLRREEQMSTDDVNLFILQLNRLKGSTTHLGTIRPDSDQPMQGGEESDSTSEIVTVDDFEMFIGEAETRLCATLPVGSDSARTSTEIEVLKSADTVTQLESEEGSDRGVVTGIQSGQTEASDKGDVGVDGGAVGRMAGGAVGRVDGGMVKDSETLKTSTQERSTASLVKSVKSTEPNIGPFLTSLLNKLETMKSNTLYVNLLLTGLLARLACYPQPLLRSLLLSHKLVFQPYVKSLVQVLGTVRYRLDEYIMTLSIAERDSMLVQAQQYLYWREEVSRLGGGQAPPLPPGAVVVTPQPSLPAHRPSSDKKRRLSDFLFGSKQLKQLQLDTRQGARFVNRAPGTKASAKGSRDSVEKKNAVYCALIFKEFLKELAALCQEHVLVQVEM